MQSFNLKDEIFGARSVRIDREANVVFVADLFIDDYVGGAELTSEAIISESPYKVMKLKSQDVTMELLQQGMDKYWIFGNFAGLNPQLIPSIVGNLKYSVLEYDYKYCRFRSPEKHAAATNTPCDCHNQMNGKLISAFYHGADSMWWMSEGQKRHYTDLFPFLSEKSSIVLSSVFSKNTLGTIRALREGIKKSGEDRKGWIVLGSESWVKGFDDAKKWCEENGKEPEILWNVPYETTLAKLAASEGFVYLPKGKDTCPRMVIEAKLLGCALHLNDSVQHKDEEWFATDDLESIEEYLYAAPALFWNAIRSMMDYVPRISGYLTTYNCVAQNYPFAESIKSMLGFCNEVVVVDGGSTDGTWEKLNEWAAEESKLVLRQIVRDWNHPRFAVFDGAQKAEARALCTGDFLWQMDSDEVVHENDYEKIKNIVKKFPKGVELLALPVVEYWGSSEKVRVDVNPWKWRLSRNNKNITHGIPKQHRRTDEEGRLYSAGSDGCDYIYADTFEPVPFVSFYTNDADNARQHALNGNKEALEAYENWVNAVTNNLPGVHHYSWYDIERKIHTYKNYWSKHWTALFNQVQDDTAENNKFFGRPWSEVSDQDIKDLAAKMKSELGGWIFHSLVDFSRPTPSIKVHTGSPTVMKDWTGKVEGKQ